ncbi:diaminopimelate epimerase [Alicyclobacillus fodiniaquatilis]|uniref:Diaminopimelate epimerase n=1 Tax=Alicyclobacillus fodiniaquatilis TaxID=1661150 RepID=A0ABW4JJS6_9BACL
MDFYRYHGLGNDYLVVDPNKTSVPINEESVRAICKPHFGEGADGVLYGPLFTKSGDIQLRIFNPDGSEAEKSGNGTRIFARYLVDEGYRNSVEPFSFQTLGGMVTAHVIDRRNKIVMDMGAATFLSTKIPVLGEEREVVNEHLAVNGRKLTVTCVSMGNPHCVVPVNMLSKDLALEMGPHLENHAMFPNRTNVQFMRVIDRHHIQIEIWERGAGYTLASGSSSCAAAAAAFRLGLTQNTVKVQMAGGELEIVILDNYKIQMTGPVVFVSKGVLSNEIFA